MTYNPGIPTPTQNLSVSQGLIKTNFTTANTSFGINHFPFDDLTTNNGLHKDINQFKRVGNAPNLTDTYTLFTKDYTPVTTGGVPDTQLFGITAGGGISQFSGNLVGDDGWCWVGGVLLQWGIATTVSTGSFASGTATGSVTFLDRVTGAIAFPTDCFIVIPGTRNNAAPTGSRYVGITILSKSATGFTWSANGASAASNGFFWYAVGN